MIYGSCEAQAREPDVRAGARKSLAAILILAAGCIALAVLLVATGGKETILLGGFTAHLDLDAVTLVGWSMGALVAWEFMRGPESGRVAGIVTIDMVPKVLNDADWQHGLRAGTHLYDVDIDLTRMRDDWPAFTRAQSPIPPFLR